MHAFFRAHAAADSLLPCSTDWTLASRKPTAPHTAARRSALTHPEPPVQVGGASVRDTQHEQRHRVELAAAADREAEAARPAVQLHLVKLVGVGIGRRRRGAACVLTPAQPETQCEIHIQLEPRGALSSRQMSRKGSLASFVDQVQDTNSFHNSAWPQTGRTRFTLWAWLLAPVLVEGAVLGAAAQVRLAVRRERHGVDHGAALRRRRRARRVVCGEKTHQGRSRHALFAVSVCGLGNLEPVLLMGP